MLDSLNPFDHILILHRPAVQHIESALKVATACMKYKIMKAECLINVGRLDVRASFFV